MVRLLSFSINSKQSIYFYFPIASGREETMFFAQECLYVHGILNDINEQEIPLFSL